MSIPGIKPATKSSATETLAITAYIINPILGGITGPTVDEARVIAALKGLR